VSELVEQDVLTNHFCTYSYVSVLLTTLSLTVFTQRNFVAYFLQAKCDFTPKMFFLRFWAPFGAWGQRTMIILGSLESA